MESVVIYEKQPNGELFSLLYRCLSSFGKVLTVNSKKLSGSSGADFLLAGVKNVREIKLQRGVLLFEKGFCGEACDIYNLTPVIHFDDSRAAGFLKGKTMPTVTVGASGRATLSIASFCREQAGVSLQRSIHTLSGKKIEPCDFTVKNTGRLSMDDILLLSAVLLLLDIPMGYDFFPFSG